jgi:transcription elongation factor GreA
MDELDLIAQPGGPILLTPEGYRALQAELEKLTVEKRADIAERIRDSKQHGEFSEDNTELDEIKFEQALIETRISELKGLFANAQMLDVDLIPTDQVGVGSYVTVEDAERGIKFEVRMVASVEADPDNDLISYESPMGQALFARAVGDVVEFDAPAGRLRYKITGIRR